MKKAVLFEKTHSSSSVRCLACSWYCTISRGHVGVCGTRMNRNGALYSLVYGNVIGLDSDPVEKKPLYHFLPGRRLLSFGTVGCNFGCLFCQNAWMSQGNKVHGSSLMVDSNSQEIKRYIQKISTTITPKKIVEMAIDQGAAGIAYTYNEPSIFVEFAHDTAKIAKKKNVKNVFVSNGYESKETFDYMKPYLDAINIDLKSFRSEFYRTVCKAQIEPVKQNIQRFFDEGIETEVTTLIIPGQNDSDKELTDIASFLVSVSADIPWHISAFHPDYKMTDFPSTPHETLLRAYGIGKNAGLRYIYIGNIQDADHSATYCPECNTKIISRNGYDTYVDSSVFDNGHCIRCKKKIYGTWN